MEDFRERLTFTTRLCGGSPNVLPSRKTLFAPRKAFSLIELLLVVAIMGIVAGLAAPRYSNALNRYRADAAARRIAADLNMVQSRARATSASRTITFNTASSSYQLNGESSLDRAADTYTVNLTSEPYFVSISSLSLGTAPVSTNGTATLTFNGYGVPDSAGTLQIRAGATTRNVWVDADTGTARIQ